MLLKRGGAGWSNMASEMASLPLYTKLFPFEIPFFLYQFTEHFYRLLYQQYYFQQLANQTIGQANHTVSISGCLTQDDVVNYTGNKTFLLMQEHVNRLNMYSEILFLGLSGLTALLLGPLSDIIGRKPILIFTVVGLILTAVLQLLIIHFRLDVYYYLICAVFFGGTGGFGTVMTLMIATIHDVTPKWVFTVRLGLLESGIAIARMATSLGTNNWIQMTGCNFNPPAWLMIVVVALAITAVILMPETLCKETRQQNKTQGFRGVTKIINGLKIYAFPWYIGKRNYWQLITATTVLSLASIGIGAYNNIMNYFLHNKPLEWSYDRIGIFGAVYSAAMGGTLIILLPVLITLKLSKYLICLIGSLFAVVTNILIANVQTDWEMFTSELAILSKILTAHFNI